MQETTQSVPLPVICDGMAASMVEDMKRHGDNPVLQAMVEAFQNVKGFLAMPSSGKAEIIENVRGTLKAMFKITTESPDSDVQRYSRGIKQIIDGLDDEESSIRTEAGFKTWEEYLKAPAKDRAVWAKRHPDEFGRLAREAMGSR